MKVAFKTKMNPLKNPIHFNCTSLSDYSPFGVELASRIWSIEEYRNGFQKQEKDKELWDGAMYYKYRVEDPRLGRFFSVDPLVAKFEGWSSYNFCLDNPLRYVEPDGRAPLDWYVNNKTGEYQWIDGNGSQKGYTGVGSFKVTYNDVKNELNVYYGKDSKFVKSIDMNQENGKYKTDEAATFALISAELGGAFVNNADPTVQPLIIGAIIDNRLSLDKEFSSDGTVQGIKGFQAMDKRAYSDFKYGNKRRFGEGVSGLQKRNMNIGLSTVYTGTLDAVSILNKYYSVGKGETKQFGQMLYYAHGKGFKVNGDFDIAIPAGTNDAFQYVRGDNNYKTKLK